MAYNRRGGPRGGQRQNYNAYPHREPFPSGSGYDAEMHAPFIPTHHAQRGRQTWKSSVPRKPARAPVSDKPAQVPQGAFLSKTESTLKNDPLYNEAVFAGPGETFSRTPEVLSTHPGFEGLSAVISSEYNTLSAAAVGFSKNVSHAMYAFYATLVSYFRMLKVIQLNSQALTFEEKQFLDFMERFNFQLPQMLSMYLSGFGNTNINGKDIKCQFIKPHLTEAERPGGVSGFFGPIDEVPGAYARYPCPRVAAQRIMEDLRFSRARRGQPAWNLPQDLGDPDHPLNEYCIGYAPAIELREDLIGVLECFGITPNDFPSDMETIPFHVELLKHVNTYLRVVRGLVVKPLPIVAGGSVAQLVPTKPSGGMNTKLFRPEFIQD